MWASPSQPRPSNWLVQRQNPLAFLVAAVAVAGSRTGSPQLPAACTPPLLPGRIELVVDVIAEQHMG